MIHVVFTLDYEIYGNGEGDLSTLVLEPAERLAELFLRHGVRFVNFVEVAEFEKIESHGTDSAIAGVVGQIRRLHGQGFETALHIHPQWYNATREGGRWLLNYDEYNLCTLSRPRIAEIVDKAAGYLRYLVDDERYVPLSFRAGNWLFQPTQPAASVLAGFGVKVDSSVFKGGRQHAHGLDYRRAERNGYFWRFGEDVNVSDSSGAMMEVPIHTELVPAWKMATAKRMAFKGPGPMRGSVGLLNRLRDLARLRYPLKLDFCRMTLEELTTTLGKVVLEDQRNPERLRPVVAIGHTKDLVDLDTVESFLHYLNTNNVQVSTFRDLAPSISAGERPAE